MKRKSNKTYMKYMKKLIKNGTIATDTEVFNGDILIDGEKIIEIGSDICAAGAEVIDAAGKPLGRD